MAAARAGALRQGRRADEQRRRPRRLPGRRRHPDRGLEPGPRRQPHRPVLHRPGAAPADARARRRGDHQRRLDRGPERRQRRRRLHHLQARGHRLHPPALLRLRAQRDPLQRDLPGRGGDRDDEGDLRLARRGGDGGGRIGADRPLGAARRARQRGALPRLRRGLASSTAPSTWSTAASTPSKQSKSTERNHHGQRRFRRLLLAADRAGQRLRASRPTSTATSRTASSSTRPTAPGSKRCCRRGWRSPTRCRPASPGRAGCRTRPSASTTRPT